MTILPANDTLAFSQNGEKTFGLHGLAPSSISVREPAPIENRQNRHYQKGREVCQSIPADHVQPERGGLSPPSPGRAPSEHADHQAEPS